MRNIQLSAECMLYLHWDLLRCCNNWFNSNNKMFECECEFDRYDRFGVFDVFSILFTAYICALLHHTTSDDEKKSPISFAYFILHQFCVTHIQLDFDWIIDDSVNRSYTCIFINSDKINKSCLIFRCAFFPIRSDLVRCVCECVRFFFFVNK